MLQKLSKFILVTILVFSFTGCLTNNVDFSKIHLPNFNISPNVPDKPIENDLTPKLVDSLKNASKDECLFLAKMWLGIAEYMEHNKSITNTADLFPPKGVIVSLRDSYNWKVKTVEEFTKLTKEDLESEKGLNALLPREIDDEYRKKIVRTCRIYGEAALKAASNK